MSPHDHDQERDEALAADELALLAYVDGELEGEALAAFVARLDGDRALRARVRALTAIGQFLRQDAARIYAGAEVDTIVEGVMERVASPARPDASANEVEVERAPLRLVKGGASGEDVADPGQRAELAREGARVSEVHPATSRGARRSKNTVVWGAFVVVAAAAAALVVFLRSNPIPEAPVAPMASAPSAKPTETIAIKPPAPAPAPIPESEPTLKVENLEVSEGASIIYTQNGASVVWLTGNEASK